MTKAEKVTKGLEAHEKQDKCVSNDGEACPYYSYYDCSRRLADDALELLKEKEAVKPERESSGVTWWNVCGACRTAINPNDKYCHECGQAVKWE